MASQKPDASIDGFVGASWTPTDLGASDFGIAIAPQFSGTSGNDRVGIDSVSVTVYFNAAAGYP